MVGVASSELDPIRQKANMETFMGLDPDFITCQPQDLHLAASTFDPLVEKGIGLVFLSNIPTGYEPGVHYVAGLTDSLYDMGRDAADLIAEAIGGEGKILTITVAGVNYVCNTRDAAFRETIESKYPNIEIVADGGFQAMSEAGPQASGLVTRYPDVKGIYVSFSNPAVDVLEAVKGLGRTDIKIITMDLDSVSALDMAQGGNVYGFAIDLAYSMGFGRALLGAYHAIEKPAPKYVTSPSFVVTRDNLEEGWLRSFGVELPADLKAALQHN
jgi:ribose transport system substrate-binding protein